MNNENGYVIYPDSVGKMDLREACEYARRRSAEDPREEYRVEDCDTQKTVVRYRRGEAQLTAERQCALCRNIIGPQDLAIRSLAGDLFCSAACYREACPDEICHICGKPARECECGWGMEAQ